MMEKAGTGKKENLSGVSRRDVLKIMGAGAIYTLLPNERRGESSGNFSPSGGEGLIFVVGDGMPLGVIKGMHEIRTRIHGDKGTNFYSKMKDVHSNLGYMSTESLSSIVTDSAPASVAWSTGSKTLNRALASLPDGRPLKTIMELLKEQGYACGLATTTRVTHATPAAWVSHQMQRDDEDAIALDYLKFKPDVLLGGGNRFFDPSGRKDGKDLFKAFSDEGYDVVRERANLLRPEIASSPKSLLGVFSSSHMSYYLDRLNQPELGKRQPSLPEMTKIALQKLSSNPKGFILQVEAGRIDHANHSSDAWAAILDTYELDLTLAVIDEYLKVNPKTLVIVTSDHGNSGWGINGTGPEYNDSTEALKKYQPIKASFEVIKTRLKKETTPAEIKDIFEHFTTFRITDGEAAMIRAAMQPDYIPFHGDYLIQPDAMMGKILAHSLYTRRKDVMEGPALIRRGNVGFTSTNHTGEDQILLSYGYKAKQLGLHRHVDNTYLFSAMCEFFGIKYKNPTMTEEEAKLFIKTASLEEWRRHMELHVA
ncbi:MAG: alkaline phosphatase [Thermodesulfobacteriota bacterium]|nr:alkaline phosphatase [Thermodesulfobacteriota bacterium]